MSSNPFQSGYSSKTGLVRDMVPVTPNDSADNVGTDNIAVGLYVTGAGDVVFETLDRNVRTVTVAANRELTCAIRRVHATGTTATGIHALIA